LYLSPTALPQEVRSVLADLPALACADPLCGW
jgi:hypothetical protein